MPESVHFYRRVTISTRVDSKSLSFPPSQALKAAEQKANENIKPIKKPIAKLNTKYDNLERQYKRHNKSYSTVTTYL